MPLISVIVPNYNHARFLQKRIDSILAQTFNGYEIIIVDDASTDDSVRVIEAYRKEEKVSHIIYNAKNSGSPFGTWQQGIDAAKGEWIWIAESDDFAEPAFLEEAVRTFADFPSAGIFYCDGLIWEDDEASDGKSFARIKNRIFDTAKWSNSYGQSGVNEINECLKFDCTINNVSGVVFKRSAIGNAVSRLREFKYYGDWYFYILLCLTTDICYSNKPLNVYRKHKSNHSNTRPLVTDRREYFLILQLLWSFPAVTDKNYLLLHFAYYYLSVGLTTRGPGMAIRITGMYFATDFKLAMRVTPRLFLLKAFKRKYLENRIMHIEDTESAGNNAAGMPATQDLPHR